MKKVNVIRQPENIPTYIPKPANTLPMFFEKKPYQGASGKLYPIPYSDGITDEKKDVSYDVFTLENEYIYTKLLPQVGGKILRRFGGAADENGQHTGGHGIKRSRVSHTACAVQTAHLSHNVMRGHAGRFIYNQNAARLIWYFVL